jgi:hypothetical protein
MSTQFSFENVFRAASTRTVLASYFDPDHLATQDALAELTDRVVVESATDDKVQKCTWRVAHARPLPVYARPFVTGGRLSYLETMVWRLADDAIDFTVVPEILGGRVSIDAVYELRQVGEGQILRRYQGSINVNIRLLSGRIEKAILTKFEEAMPMMTQCTQGWLDKTANR